MLNTFYNPVEALKDAKAEGSIGTTFIVLVIAAVLIVVAEIIAVKSFSIYVVLGILVGVVVLNLIGALLLKIAIAILGAKEPTYFAALTAGTYAIAPLSAALVISAVLALIPVVGIVLVTLLLMIAGVVMGATLIRGIMELAHADLLLALVAAWVVMGLGMMMGYGASAAMALMRMVAPLGLAVP